MQNVIQGLWIGGRLTELEVMCIRSFQHHEHEFHLYTYGAVEDIPKGTIILDGNQILPKDKIFRSPNGGLGSFSDFFRWELLRKRGGIWADLDIICLKPFKFDEEIIFGKESPNLIGTAVLQFPKGHFMTNVMAKVCDDVNIFQPIDTNRSVIKKIARKIFWGKEKSRARSHGHEPGAPAYFTKFLRFYELDQLAKPQSWFFPFPYWEWEEIFVPNSDAFAKIEGSYAIHVWNNTMHRDPRMDKNHLNFNRTLIGHLRERYL